MNFATPEMLWLLLATVPLLVWFLVWSWRKRQRLIGQFVQSRLLAQLTVGVSRVRQKARLVLIGLASVSILLALARPQYGYAWEEVRRRGIDIMVAMDVSRSMLATDLQPNRLARAKLAALDLLRIARSDRLGLLAFAGTAFLQCPLTLDENAFAQSVNALEIGSIPQGGTAIAKAIDTAIGAFRESGDNHKALVLFTDGEDLEGTAGEAALRAAQAGILVFPIGIGTHEGDRLRFKDESGRTVPINDLEGRQVVSRLTPDVLEHIAKVTGGGYLPLAGPDTMEVLYRARLASLPRANLATRLMRLYHERFQWPLALAIVLLVIEVLLPDRVRAARGEPPPASLAKAASGPVAALLLILGLLPATVQASTRSAYKAYESGRYGDSYQEYQKLLTRKPSDPGLRFNAGTAAYRDRNFAAATNELRSAILSSDPELLARAYYNLGNALYRSGQSATSPDEALAQWKQAAASYEATLKLEANDPDAAFNRDFVSRKIEELEKQMASQQPQQQDPSSESKEKDPSSQGQPQSKPSTEPPKDQPPQPPPPAKPQSPTNSAPSQPKPEKEKESPQKGPEEKAPAPGQDQAKPGADGGKEAPGERRNGLMTPEQARQLLEAAKAEEQAWRFQEPPSGEPPRGPIRDW
ncbi:MAG: vWA domain-containing protein [Limisphaerales bacterium]